MFFNKRNKNPNALSSSRPPSPRKQNWRWKLILTITLAIPVFLETLDYTVVATAQPHIASVFNRLDLQSYIGTSYLLTSTVFLPLFASVADIYGRHFALQLSLIFFIAGSALSTGAKNMEMMLAGRGVAGVGAAGMLTVVRVIMADSGSLDDNNWQVSILFLLYSIGYSVGPFIGGVLVAVSFRWVFAINLPCCVLAMLLCFILLRNRIKGGQPSQRLPVKAGERETAIARLLRIDWIGALFFIAAGILILLGLGWGSTEGWSSTKVITSFIIGGLLSVACLVWEYLLERQDTASVPFRLRALWADPMLPLDVFRSYDVCTVQFASFVSGLVMLVMFYFVAIFMTIVTGLSPEKAGIQLVYFAPGMGGGTLISIQMVKYLRQPKYPIILGSLIIPVALGLISMGMQMNKQNLVNGFMVMTGIGIGLTAGSLAVHARFSQPEERVAIVSALTLFFRSLGGTVGLAQCAAVLNSKVKSSLADALASGKISLSDAIPLAFVSQHGGLSSLQSLGTLPVEVQTLVRDAFREGTRWAFISLIPWCAIALVMSLFLSNIVDTDREDVPAIRHEPKPQDRGVQVHVGARRR